MITIEENAIDAFYSKYFTEAKKQEYQPPANSRRIVIGNSQTGEEGSLNGNPQAPSDDIALDDNDDIDLNQQDEPVDDGGDEAPAMDDGGADATGDDAGTNDQQANAGDAGGEEGPALDDEGADPNADDGGGDDDGPMLDDGGEAPPADGDDTPPDDGGGDNNEGIHKQMLFKRFMDLRESIDGFIKRLEESLNQDIEVNRNYSTVADKLKQLNEFIYDYMVVKFKDASYASSVLFYQRSLATAHLSIAILGDEIEKFDKKEKNTKTKGKRKQNK